MNDIDLIKKRIEQYCTSYDVNKKGEVVSTYFIRKWFEKIDPCFKAVDYDVVRFVREGRAMLHDDELFANLLIYVCFEFIDPICEYQYGIAYEGSLDFSCNSLGLSEADTYQRFALCKTEEEIWQIFSEGIGDENALYHYYFEKDAEKANKFFEFLLKKKFEKLSIEFREKNKKKKSNKHSKNQRHMKDIIVDFGEDVLLDVTRHEFTADSISVHIDKPYHVDIEFNTPFPIPNGDTAKAFLVSQVLQEFYLNRTFNTIYSDLVQDMSEDFHRQDNLFQSDVERLQNNIKSYETMNKEGKEIEQENMEAQIKELECVREKRKNLFRDTIEKYLSDAIILSTAKAIEKNMQDILSEFIMENPGFYGK